RVEALDPDVEHAQGLLDDLGEGAADGHDLADALHLAADAQVGAAELAQVPAGDLDHQVVERRLEEGGGAAGGGVGDVRRRVAGGGGGGDVGERVAGGLAGERRRAGEARVDLDDAIVDVAGGTGVSPVETGGTGVSPVETGGTGVSPVETGV